jgi:hypothetical protein
MPDNRWTPMAWCWFCEVGARESICWFCGGPVRFEKPPTTVIIEDDEGGETFNATWFAALDGVATPI